MIQYTVSIVAITLAAAIVVVAIVRALEKRRIRRLGCGPRQSRTAESMNFDRGTSERMPTTKYSRSVEEVQA